LPAIAAGAATDADKAAAAIMLSSLTGRFMMFSCGMAPVCAPGLPFSVRCLTLDALYAQIDL
jgi:hypothetical protein